MINSFTDIDNMVKEINKGKPKVLSVAAANEDHILHAVCEARNQGIIDAILVGNKRSMLEIAEENGLDLHDLEIIDCENSDNMAPLAVEQVRNGKAQLLMKGLLESSVILRAVLDKDKGLRDGRLLSYAGVFEIKGFNRLIFITDEAINLEPDLEEKEIIMKNAVSFAKALGVDCPKVAFVCPIEKVNMRMTSTLHAHALVEKYSGNIDFHVGGPYGLDIAVSEEAAKIKGISDSVAGKADILVLNDIGVGNAVHKSLVHFSHARHAGLVIGAKVPVLMTSRSDSNDAKLDCIKLGVLLADHYRQLGNSK